MSGPYRTEADAAAEPMPRAVAALHAAGLVESGDPQKLVFTAKLAALVDACEQANVRLGGYDMRVLGWLAGWEAATVQVFVGIILRAARTSGAANSDVAD